MHYPHSQALGHLAHLYLWPPPPSPWPPPHIQWFLSFFFISSGFSNVWATPLF